MRIGHGYDVHRFKDGRPCILCGVTLPCGFGPDGHSDADVALHALMDALLGAAALGDIGYHFPPSDPAYKDVSSVLLLRYTAELLAQRGYSVVNTDITIVAQRPRLSEYIPAMREKVAKELNIDLDRVSVKATTEEGLGATGEGLGIAAHAVVLIDK